MDKIAFSDVLTITIAVFAAIGGLIDFLDRWKKKNVDGRTKPILVLLVTIVICSFTIWQNSESSKESKAENAKFQDTLTKVFNSGMDTSNKKMYKKLDSLGINLDSIVLAHSGHIGTIKTSTTIITSPELKPEITFNENKGGGIEFVKREGNDWIFIFSHIVKNATAYNIDFKTYLIFKSVTNKYFKLPSPLHFGFGTINMSVGESSSVVDTIHGGGMEMGALFVIMKGTCYTQKGKKCKIYKKLIYDMSKKNVGFPTEQEEKDVKSFLEKP